MRFASFSSELGDTALTLTPALLAAVLAFERPPRHVILLEESAAPLPRAKRPARLLLERLPHLLARAPQEVRSFSMMISVTGVATEVRTLRPQHEA